MKPWKSLATARSSGLEALRSIQDLDVFRNRSAFTSGASSERGQRLRRRAVDRGGCRRSL